jgi:hypothetical protein
MATRVIYFGNDNCHRIPVLAAAGFHVEQATTLAALRIALSSDPLPRIAFFCDHQGRLPHEAIALARAHSAIHAILFRETNLQWNEAEFDLVIPALTPPPSWLDEIAQLLEIPFAEAPIPPRPQLVPAPSAASPSAPPPPFAPGPASVAPHAPLADRSASDSVRRPNRSA